jgi:hypothetical protein
MRRIAFFLLALALQQAAAQTPVKRIFTGSGGVFEFAPPYADYVTAGYYDPDRQTFQTTDTVRTQSVQYALANGEDVFLLAQDSVIRYSGWNGKRLASGFFEGGSPQTAVADAQHLFVGKWYGTADSFLHVFNRGDLSRTQVIGGLTREVKGLLVMGDTLWISQNLPGSVDACPPFGCFSDSIGQLGIYRISTGSFLGVFDLDSCAGIAQLYEHQGQIIAVCTAAEAVALISPSDLQTEVHLLSGDVGKGLGLKNDELFLNFNGSPAVFDLAALSLSAGNLSPISYPAAAAADLNSGRYFQTLTDYSSFGRCYVAEAGSLIDSFDTGVSPEAIAYFEKLNNTPVAVRDFMELDYTQDSVLNVLANDSDGDALPLELSLLSLPIIPGAVASIESAGALRYTPAVGLLGSDSVQYRICDQAGFCDSAWMVVNVYYAASAQDRSRIHLTLFPNPARDFVEWNTDVKMANVLVLAQDGRLSASYNEVQRGIDISELAPGLYRLLMIDESGVQYISAFLKP